MAICTQDMHMWHKEMIEFDDTLSQKGKLHLCYIEYFYAAHLISKDKTEEAKTLIQTIEKNLETISDTTHITARATLIASLYMIRCALSDIEAIYYLPKALLKISDAEKLNENSPYMNIEKGNFYYHLPEILGGDFNKAIQFYNNGIKIFEAQESDLKYNWYYLNAVLWLAKSYEQIGESKEAIRIYRKMKHIAPEFIALDRWIDKNKQ